MIGLVEFAINSCIHQPHSKPFTTEFSNAYFSFQFGFEVAFLYD